MMRIDDDRELARALHAWVRACGGDPNSPTSEVVLAEQDVGEKLEAFAKRWATNNGYTRTKT